MLLNERQSMYVVRCKHAYKDGTLKPNPTKPQPFILMIEIAVKGREAYLRTATTVDKFQRRWAMAQATATALNEGKGREEAIAVGIAKGQELQPERTEPMTTYLDRTVSILNTYKAERRKLAKEAADKILTTLLAAIQKAGSAEDRATIAEYWGLRYEAEAGDDPPQPAASGSPPQAGASSPPGESQRTATAPATPTASGTAKAKPFDQLTPDEQKDATATLVRHLQGRPGEWVKTSTLKNLTGCGEVKRLLSGPLARGDVERDGFAQGSKYRWKPPAG